MKEFYTYFIDTPQNFRDILTGFIWLFVGMSIVQLVFLILHKAIIERRDKRFKLKKVMYFNGLTRSLANADQGIPPPSDPLEMNALIDVCVDIMTGASRKHIAVIHEIVRECAIPEFLVRNYKKSSLWLKQYQIVETLGFLKLPELAVFFREIIASESVLLKKNRTLKEYNRHGWLSDVRNPATRHLHLISKALWALSHVCAGNDFRHMIQVLQTPGFMSGKFNEYIFCNIIEAYRHRNEVEALLDEIEMLIADGGVSLLIKRDLVQACGTANFTESHVIVAKCTDLYSESPEMKMACIRTLGQVGDERLEELTRRYLGDGDWRVRAVAAKDARACSDAIIPALSRVLCDGSYYVRLNAALSLVRKGESGKAVLRECVDNGDKFGQDMALYALRQG